MTSSAPTPLDSKSQLRKTMGFWDVLLFNIATVLGPRWIAAAGHNGPSSISLWVLAAVFFFVPGALVINELSSRFPEEGGLYAWSREAFGPFHGFVAGWTYWFYTLFYFPALLFASAAMAEPVSVAVHAVRRARIGPGERVMVLGAGPIGQCVAMVAIELGAEVLLIDLQESRLELELLGG